MPPDAGPRAKAMILDLRKAIEAGFILAVSRYNKELKSNAEAMRLVNARKTGGDLGRNTLIERREAVHERIRTKHASLEKAGEPCTYQAVADALKAEGVKCSRSTVDRAINRRTTKRKKR